jgi:hypothetical protein
VTRTRALWLAAGVGVLVAVGYLLQRRRARGQDVPSAALPTPLVTAAPVASTSTPEVAVITEARVMEEQPAQTPLPDEQHEKELPLATWARVAIVLVALVAFFAVSLVATKHV